MLPERQIGELEHNVPIVPAETRAVDTLEQLTLPRSFGCSAPHGYMLAEPMTARHITDRLHTGMTARSPRAVVTAQAGA